jgi:hypothetical protein
MIIDNPESHFIFVYHPFVLMGRKYTIYNGVPLTNREVLQYWGKWIVLGDRPWLDELARKLDPYVEQKKIPCVKYDRNPSPRLGITEHVMMVYCDRRGREDVWEILREQGVKTKAWVTEEETMNLWMPGGPLLERWLASETFEQGTKEAIREDAGRRLNYLREHPDEIFTPWEQ